MSNRHCLRKGTYREMPFSSVLWGTTWYERCKARTKFLSWMRPFASDFSGSSHSLILFTFVSMAPAQLHQARARKWRVLSAAPAQSRSRADHQPTRRRTFRPTVGSRVARGRLSVAACILFCFVFLFYPLQTTVGSKVMAKRDASQCKSVDKQVSKPGRTWIHLHHRLARPRATRRRKAHNHWFRHLVKRLKRVCKDSSGSRK